VGKDDERGVELWGREWEVGVRGSGKWSYDILCCADIYTDHPSKSLLQHVQSFLYI